MKKILKRIAPRAWSVERWSPEYFWARISQAWFRLRTPNYPWLTKDSIAILDKWIRPDHRVIEFGSGGSTLYFAARCARLVSYEHDGSWHRKVRSRLDKLVHSNVELHCFPLDDPRYCDHVGSLADQSVDLILIDGRRRAECTWNAIPKLKPGGLLVIDNAERYLAREHGASAHSNLYDHSTHPSGPLWKMIAEHTASWERHWTDNGIWTTLILHRP
jgi:Methyltransferase domain